MNKAGLMLLASTIGMATAGFAGNASATVIPHYYSWEAASEFDDVDNANNNTCATAPAFTEQHPWCYGYETALGGAFTAFTVAEARDPSILGWGLGANSGNSLGIFHNVNHDFYTDTGGVPHMARSLDILPGNNCEFAVLRFVTPFKSRYKISGQFYAKWLDNNYEDADVHIYVNNAPVFNGSIDVANNVTHVSFTTQSLGIPANTPIDFIVGCGTNNNNYYDHVGLNAVIERK